MFLPTTIMNATGSGRSEWIAYDASCNFCLGSVRLFRRLLARHGFILVPLQTGWVRKRLGLQGDELPEEMKALLADGSVKGGIDCFFLVCERVWWLKPVAFAGKLGSAHALFDRFYRYLARNRHCLVKGSARTAVKRHHRSAAVFEMP